MTSGCVLRLLHRKHTDKEAGSVLWTPHVICTEGGKGYVAHLARLQHLCLRSGHSPANANRSRGFDVSSPASANH